MGAKPNNTRSAGKTARTKATPAKRTPAKRTPARRVPARKAATAARSARKPADAPAGATVDAYIASLSGWQREAASRLRDLIRAAAPDCVEAIKWGQPVYDDHGPVCYFKANTEHITFGFWRGTELDDPDWRLEGDGVRMKHLALRSSDEVTEESLGRFVRQAVDLNRRLGSPSMDASAGPDRAIEVEDAAISMVVPVEPPLQDDSNGVRDETSY
jgi:hypothetical protein